MTFLVYRPLFVFLMVASLFAEERDAIHVERSLVAIVCREVSIPSEALAVYMIPSNREGLARIQRAWIFQDWLITKLTQGQPSAGAISPELMLKVASWNDGVHSFFGAVSPEHYVGSTNEAVAKSGKDFSARLIFSLDKSDGILAVDIQFYTDNTGSAVLKDIIGVSFGGAVSDWEKP